MKSDSIKIIFFGTPQIAAYTLENVIKKYGVVAVVTQPDKTIGRKKLLEAPPVKKMALQYDIPVFQTEKLQSIEKELTNLSPDIGIVFAFSQIIPKQIIDIFPKGMLNIHPSILPQLRGPSPVQEAILQGLDETGVTIIKLDEKMDHGPIVMQKKITINPTHMAPDVLQQCAKLGTEMLLEIMPKYIRNEFILKEQDHAKATFSHIITRENGLIDWKNDAQSIYLQFKAYNPWPGVFTHIAEKRLKILDLEPLYSIPEGKRKPGTIFISNNAISSEEYIKGHKNCIGKRLEI